MEIFLVTFGIAKSVKHFFNRNAVLFYGESSNIGTGEKKLPYQDGGPYEIETGPFNQWTGFYMIETFVMKELIRNFFLSRNNFCRYPNNDQKKVVQNTTCVNLKKLFHPKLFQCLLKTKLMVSKLD